MNNKVTQRDWSAVYILLGGAIGMAIAMGVGRFAYTPILPLMQRDLGISNSIAGWLAGFNYLGYLAGAVLCSSAPGFLRSRFIGIGALFLSVATTFGMGLAESVFWWGFMRLISGVASAVLFIIISTEVGASLVRRGHGHWLGVLYGGIGAGIVLSGLIIPWLDRLGQWNGAWTGMGVVTALLALLAVAIVRGNVDEQQIATEKEQEARSLMCLWPMAVAYFFEGLGYIVSATFLVAIVALTPGLESYASYSWVAVGLAAVPSTILWPLISRYIGRKKALLAAYAIQASGIFLSIHADTVIEVMYAAITFGATFLGIVVLTLAEGNLRIKHDQKRATAILTASFSVGQILGPIAAGFLADIRQGFTLPLLLASICIMIGLLFTAIDRHFISQKQ